jgi:hypothetical protein
VPRKEKVNSFETRGKAEIRNQKLEIGNQKLGNGNWKLDTKK